jgi:outer membrane protein OmpA-like peptidoglycan-associated protein
MPKTRSISITWRAILMRVMRILVVLFLLPLSALAQPVSFQLRNDVPAGKKPQLVVTATERVVELSLELTRAGDELKVNEKFPSLSPGKSTTFSIGDGAPGKAHYEGVLKLTVSGQGPWSYDLSFDTVVRGASINVTYRRDHLDLEHHRLEFQASGAVAKATIQVIGDDGQEIGDGAASYGGEAPGTWLPIEWKQRPGNVMKLELHVVDKGGFGQAVHLIPWSVTIAHEDVNFETGSSAIPPSERPKLDAAFTRIAEAAKKAAPFVKVILYVAGHTDTVGTRDSNHKLSLDRAKAIAGYFREKGIKFPIAFAGFGEDLLKVKTADETPEPANRRADYVLAAEEPRAGEWRNIP